LLLFSVSFVKSPWCFLLYNSMRKVYHRFIRNAISGKNLQTLMKYFISYPLTSEGNWGRINHSEKMI